MQISMSGQAIKIKSLGLLTISTIEMGNDLALSLGSLIGSTRRTILRDLNAAFIEHEIPLTMEQYVFLHTLNRLSGEVTQQDMANLICKDKSAILRTIDVLEKQGLVQRLHDSTDRRKNTLNITNECRKILDEVSKIEKHVIDRLIIGITPQDYEAMVRAMNKIQENANSK